LGDGWVALSGFARPVQMDLDKVADRVHGVVKPDHAAGDETHKAKGSETVREISFATPNQAGQTPPKRHPSPPNGEESRYPKITPGAIGALSMIRTSPPPGAHGSYRPPMLLALNTRRRAPAPSKIRWIPRMDVIAFSTADEV